MSDWQPIATAPKDGTGVLVWFEDGCVAALFERGEWREPWGNALTPFVPTHWMPLPAPPEKEKDA